VQLVEQPPRERMFHERYPFFAASSARMDAHFAQLARTIIEHYLPENDALLVEIGSNDGTLLKHAAAAGLRHVGIDPSASVAAAAAARGVTTWCRFFDQAAANDIVAQCGHAHVVVATNALSHVAELHSVVAGIDHLLAPDGVVIVEDPYWGQVLAQTAFDQIYDEHASYFALTSVQHLFAAHGLTVFDVTPVDVHGGSMRYFICRAGTRMPSPRVAALVERELAEGAHDATALAAFSQRVDAVGVRLLDLLRRRRATGLRIVGYGATSKSTTTINYFGITPDLVEFICDTTPAKQGLFSPGAHIKVRPHEEFARNYPDCALLFSWNHAAEVRANEQAFTSAGGRWILYVPDVHET
jgi:methylation protein EvaC